MLQEYLICNRYEHQDPYGSDCSKMLDEHLQQNTSHTPAPWAFNHP